MPRPRQRGSDTTAKWEAAYRRLRPELDYLASVASDAEFGRSGRLRSAKDLQNVSDAFKEICAAVSKMEYWPLYIWTEEPSAAVVTLFGATAARWAATGGGMVEKDDGVANATGTSSSITSSTIAVAWISVLSSYGELLGFLLKAWKASSDEVRWVGGTGRRPRSCGMHTFQLRLHVHPHRRISTEIVAYSRAWVTCRARTTVSHQAHPLILLTRSRPPVIRNPVFCVFQKHFHACLLSA